MPLTLYDCITDCSFKGMANEENLGKIMGDAVHSAPIFKVLL